MKKEKIEIKNRKGLKIIGNISIPEKPVGLAFTLHGLGGFKEQPYIMILVDTLLENKYTVINFDATNSIGESEGKYENATMQNHYEDLVDIISWAKTQTWYKEPFILAGCSLGGFAVAKYAEEFPKNVKGIFPYAAVFSGELSHQAYYKFFPDQAKNWKKTGWKTRTSNSKPGTKLRLPWSHMEERLKHNLLPNASKLTMPILLVVGEKDESCPPDHQKEFYDLLSKKTKREFHIIKEAPHTFREQEHLNQLKEIFDTWLKKIK